MKLVQATVFGAVIALASVPAIAGDVAAGEAAYNSKGCSGCHGAGEDQGGGVIAVLGAMMLAEADDIDFAYPTQRFYDNLSEGKPGARAPRTDDGGDNA